MMHPHQSMMVAHQFLCEQRRRESVRNKSSDSSMLSISADVDQALFIIAIVDVVQDKSPTPLPCHFLS
jgi:hypothetical protein